LREKRKVENYCMYVKSQGKKRSKPVTVQRRVRERKKVCESAGARVCVPVRKKQQVRLKQSVRQREKVGEGK